VAAAPLASRWRALQAISIVLVVTGIDATILNVALPIIADDLQTTSSQLEWINSTYIIIFGSTILLSGTLADKVGRKTMLMLGLTVFLVGSVWSGLSNSPELLIVGRLIQGLGGGMLIPATLSLITNIFLVPEERARAIGTWAGMSGVGVGLGPILGGLLLTWFPWSSVFFVNVPIVALALVMIALWVPNSRNEDAPPIDVGGALLSIVGLFSFFFYLIEAPSRGFTDTALLGVLVFAVVLLSAFVILESRQHYPMLEVGLFKNLSFTSGVVATAFAFFALLGLMYELTLYLQSVRLLSPLVAGVILLPLAIALFFGAPRAPKLAAKFGNRNVAVAGELLAALGFILFMFLSTTGGAVIVILGLLLLGLSVAFISPVASNAVMGSVPPTKAGMGSATNSAMQQIGGSLGIAIIGGIGQILYVHSLVVTSAYASLPGEEAATASASVTGAMEMAVQTGNAALQSAAESAFIYGMHGAMIVAFLAASVGALLAWLTMPASVAEGVSDVPAM
jgi:EmrB/QacA subfamily drug resistance transporter